MFGDAISSNSMEKISLDVPEFKQPAPWWWTSPYMAWWYDVDRWFRTSYLFKHM